MRVDAHDEQRLASVATGYDIVVSAAGPDFEVHLPALRGALAAGVHFCDLGGDGRMVQQQLALDAAARDRDIVAIVGMGTNPGLNNLLAVYASRKFDRVEEMQLCTFWNLPSTFDSSKVLEGMRKAGLVAALWQTVLNLARGPVHVYRDGRLTTTEPAKSPTDVAVPDGGTVTAYPVGTPEPITLPRYLPGVRGVSSVWSIFPPQLNDLYLTEGKRIARGGADSRACGAVVLRDDRWRPRSVAEAAGRFPPGVPHLDCGDRMERR